MKILILNCDFDSSAETNGAQIIKRQLNSIGIWEIAIRNAFESSIPEDEEMRRYDRIIITGSRASAYDNEEWIKNLARAIRKLQNLNIPTMGICFGFQAIAEALGGKVEASGSYEEGFGTIHLTEEGKAHPIISHLKEDPMVYQSHGDIIKKMPKDAVALARNEHSLQAYALGKFLCVQFHPEITPEIATKMAVRDGKDVGKILNGVKNDYKLASEVIDLFVKS